ncbi:hypothetical protein FOVG_15927 [Fusarium oxysporum f. sp. pisi HDV247]|uniref:Uncharacterized protein n=1 Tax=Fusarium oxysporum f. sp. pisi HDV247 TaxID=1080344 RepID=W9NPV2_FUSOX|nr:hypothetical protein FOVG_15927 [Fusarium oxysporum f. sp. pisi HDV247]
MSRRITFPVDTSLFRLKLTTMVLCIIARCLLDLLAYKLFQTLKVMSLLSILMKKEDVTWKWMRRNWG